MLKYMDFRANLRNRPISIQIIYLDLLDHETNLDLFFIDLFKIFWIYSKIMARWRKNWPKKTLIFYTGQFLTRKVLRSLSPTIFIHQKVPTEDSDSKLSIPKICTGPPISCPTIWEEGGGALSLKFCAYSVHMTWNVFIASSKLTLAAILQHNLNASCLEAILHHKDLQTSIYWFDRDIAGVVGWEIFSLFQKISQTIISWSSNISGI